MRGLKTSGALAAAAAALILLTQGCATPSPRIRRAPLLETQRLTLLQESVTPSSLGITAEVDRKGNLRLENVHNLTLGAQASIPLLVRDHRHLRFPLVRMSLNGRTVYALVDTGSSASLMSFQGARRAGLTPVRWEPEEGKPVADDPLIARLAQTPGGQTRHYLGIARVAEIGQLTVYNVPIGILDDQHGLEGLWWMDGFQVELVLGNDFLKCFEHVILDLGHERMQLGSGAYVPNPERLAAAMPMVGKYGVPAVEALLGEKGPFPLVLDTGADFGLWIPYRLAAEIKVAPGEDASIETARNLVGQSVSYNLGSRNLNLAGFDLENVPARAAALDMGDREPEFALLGNRMLREFVVIFDHGSRKVYFEHRR